ncbi:MAG: xanthine dehydrogenase family protein molybdopterin-binding subunit [Salinarimonadaceae bacterium]|nr:MAG: xanthine dehydrogenase family protein molybdopterin-binding subunit [Salinarimonadaceae bacterium]
MLFRPIPALSRRRFLQGGAALGGALVIGVSARFGNRAMAAEPVSGLNPPAAPNAFVRIGADDVVTVIVKHLDMGQGISTGLATIVADELDADWGQMDFAFAPANAALYNNFNWGPVQGTGGSSGIANSFTQLRKAGAAARAMLVSAAASEWGVPEGEVTVERGRIRHAASGRESGFGAFAARAAALPVPENPVLKTPDRWNYIGKTAPRLDARAKTTGRALYSFDVRRPGMLTAMVARPPRFGARLVRFDDRQARAVAGVVEVAAIPTGVAVLARDTWSAMKGREALVVEWDESRAEKRSTQDIEADYRDLARTRGARAVDRGDTSGAMLRAARLIEAEYDFPYLAHAAMEPISGVIEKSADGGYEAWGAFQIQTIDQATIAAIMGVTTDKVRLNTLVAGGSFGRRATPQADWIAEAAHILKASGEGAPVHLVWTREDDMRAGYFRPLVHHRVRISIDERGRPLAWEQSIVAKSILIGSVMESFIIDGLDSSTFEGAEKLPYDVPAMRLEVHNAREQVPVLWWRSVGHSHTAHVMETMIDELAEIAGEDPLAYRLSLMDGASREAAVLRLAAEKAGWDVAPPPGIGRGIAVHRSFGSVVAMVAEVSVSEEIVKVERIVAAVDCGLPINPDNIRSQVEGSVGFALATVLRERVTLVDGVVQETNFDTYEPTRFSEMPLVETHIMPSDAEPTGMGEPAVPTLAPAIANAVFALTGRRVRSLPLDRPVASEV